ncbi:MAG: histidine--tRNA ligase [Capsulimonadaceae bacterium]|nr:histidine--tRNA ligase [Capsulimonadaceae bacterium]
MAKFQAPKGTHDVYPGARKWHENTALWNRLETIFRELAALHGYQEVRTPVIEPTGLFTRAVGEGTDIVSKEMYTFESKGGDSLTLRPEGTAPALRAYIENSIYAEGGVAKLFYIGPIFRYERPQEGRFRQHTQFGIEALGSRDPRIDAEVVWLALSIYRRLGLDRLVTKVNSVGCPNCRPAYRDALVEFARPFVGQMSADNQRRFNENPLRMLDSKDPGDQKLLEGAPSYIDYICDECRTHFEAFKANLTALGAQYEIDSRLVRGFDYYTKTAFEIQSPDLGAQSTLCGGGRYDGLVEELGGPSTPGIGFGLGIERVLIALEKLNRRPDTAPPLTAFIVTLGENAASQGLALLTRLREAGIAADMDYAGRSMKAQMRAAGKSAAPYALIVGDDELASGDVVVKTMATGEQTKATLDEFIAKTIGQE